MKKKINTCKVCGCTDVHACVFGCFWVDNEKTVCSKCADKVYKVVTEERIRNLDHYVLDFDFDKQTVNLLHISGDNWEIPLKEALILVDFGIDGVDFDYPYEMETTIKNWISELRDTRGLSYEN